MKKTKPIKHKFTVRFVGGPLNRRMRTWTRPWPLKHSWVDENGRTWTYYLREGGPEDVPRYVLA